VTYLSDLPKSDRISHSGLGLYYEIVFDLTDPIDSSRLCLLSPCSHQINFLIFPLVISKFFSLVFSLSFKRL